MNAAVELVGQGILLPAAVAMAAVALLRRLLPAETSERYAAAAGFSAAYFVGAALLPSWTELAPARHWHWIPYLALASAVAGPIALAAGVHRVERWLLYLTAAIFFAWLLTPTWASLDPPRTVWIPLLAGYLFLLAALLEPLPKRIAPATVLAMFAAAAACVGGLIAAEVSVTYAQGAGVASAALAGCWGAACFASKAPTARGACLAYAAVVGGWAFVGCIEPRTPLYALLLVPAAPLALWLAAAGPLARLGPWKATVVQALIVLLVLAVAAGIVLWPAGQSSPYIPSHSGAAAASFSPS